MKNVTKLAKKSAGLSQKCSICPLMQRCTLEFDTPREAFAALIDKVSGKGTWESNPYVWVYEFELMK